MLIEPSCMGECKAMIYILRRKGKQKSSRDRWDQSVCRLSDPARSSKRAESLLLLLVCILLSVASVRDHIRVGRTLLPENAASQPTRLLSRRSNHSTSGTKLAIFQNLCTHIPRLPAQCLRFRDKTRIRRDKSPLDRGRR